MFAFLRRAARNQFGSRAAAQFARTEFVDRPGWTDSASDLFKGTEIIEYSGDFAATVLLEHFTDQASESTPSR